MASYQAGRRDPLLDSATQAILERRGYELLGLVLIALGFIGAAMTFSYHANDPSWMYAADTPVQNWLGTFGASMSAVVMMVVGAGFWVVPLSLIGWGLRFVCHQGRSRLSRVLFLPATLITAALYASTLVAPADWPQFGYGGLLGDTLLGVLLTALPVQSAFGVKLVSVIMGFVTLLLFAFSVGFTKREIAYGLKIGLVGSIMLYAALLRAFGYGASGLQHFGQKLAETRAARQNYGQQDDHIVRMHDGLDTGTLEQSGAEDFRKRATSVVRANPLMPTRPLPADPQDTHSDAAVSEGQTAFVAAARQNSDNAPHEETSKKASGFLSGLLKRTEPKEAELEPLPEPELVVHSAAHAEAPSQERVTARISDAILKKKTEKIAPEFVQKRKPQPLVFQQPAPELVPHAGDVEAPMDVLDNMPYDQEDDAQNQHHNPFAASSELSDMQAYAAPRPSPIMESEGALVLDQTMAEAATQAPEHHALQPAPQASRSLSRERHDHKAAEKSVVQHPLKRATMPSKRALAEAQPSLQFEEAQIDYECPPLNLLTHPNTIERHHLSDEALEENARMLENVLDDYGVKGEIISVRPGPVVTMYELEPAPGLKASRVIGLADDIARSMSALSARVSTIPGRSVIGIELPNENREMVVLREMLSARDFGDSNMKLPLALGKDISGEPIIANLAKMPHLLIAGTTGSGKSVAINTMILSLLYKLTPDECRMIMIDPKMLELSVYDGIPHLLSPVVTDPKKAVVALKWAVGEMEERYRKMSKMGVRNIDGYNGRVKDALDRNEMFSRTVQTGFDEETGDPIFETEEFKPEKIPYIVVIVDEMADLMMVAGKEIEACIQRLAQMARASGIHLIMATQRPSVDVITGTIKANFPTRISFQVTSKIDSRTILGEMGAEQLLGMGDMLYMAGGSRITRVHGPFCSDEEVEEIVNYLKAYGPPDYISGVVDGPAEGKESDIDLVLGLGGNTNGEDALYDQAVAIVAKDRKCSTSYIQRKLSIGYNKAARLVEQMEDEGLVSTANHVGKREILIPEQG